MPRADAAVFFLTGEHLPEEMTAQANELISLLLQSPAASLVQPMLQGIAVPMAGSQPTAVAPQPSPVPVPAPTTPLQGRALRTLGRRASPFLSLQGDYEGAVAKMIAADERLGSAAAWTAADRRAITSHLPPVLRRATATTTTAPGAGSTPAGTSTGGPELSADEGHALSLLSRAVATWPPTALASPAFVLRPLLAYPPSSAALQRDGCLRALVDRVLPRQPVSPTGAQLLACTAVSNALSLPATAEAVFADPECVRGLLSAAMVMRKGPPAPAPEAQVAAALFHNLTMHEAFHADPDRSTQALCAVMEALHASPAPDAAVVDRLARVLGQALIFGSEATRSLAADLGAAELASTLILSADLRADILQLLRHREQ